MKLCFFCYTPFHLFNAANIKYNIYSNDYADLYLYNSEEGGTKGLIEGIKKTELFDNIYLIDNSWREDTFFEKVIRKIFRIRLNSLLRRARRNYIKVKKRNCTYDIVWSYGSAMEMYIIMGVSLRNNPNTVYFGYEEGDGSYRLPCTNALTSQQIDYLGRRLKIQMPDKPNKMLLYSPSYALPIVTTTIEEMPKVTTKLAKEIYPLIWNMKEMSLPYNVFFMATGSYDQSFTFALYDRLKEFPEINMVVKAHPRFQRTFEGTDIELLNCGSIPWEIICGNVSNIESKLIIGVYSTAMITAKSIYGKEPTIIFLNEMDILKNSQRIDKGRTDVLQRFIKSYSDQTRLAFPKNTDELFDCISIWYQKQF